MLTKSGRTAVALANATSLYGGLVLEAHVDKVLDSLPEQMRGAA